MKSYRIMTNHRKWLPVGVRPFVVVLAFALALVAAAANATIPGADGLITGCYIKTTGALRVTDTDVGTPAKCRSTEIALAWNQMGVQGEPGETGPAGPAGEQGPAGTVATSKVFFVHNGGGGLTSQEGGQQVSMTLPAGSYVIEARATLQNSSNASDGVSAICEMPGDVSVVKFLDDRSGPDWHGTQEIVEMTTAINHSGGALEVLDCFSNFPATSVHGITVLATPVGSVVAG